MAVLELKFNSVEVISVI